MSNFLLVGPPPAHRVRQQQQQQQQDHQQQQEDRDESSPRLHVLRFIGGSRQPSANLRTWQDTTEDLSAEFPAVPETSQLLGRRSRNEDPRKREKSSVSEIAARLSTRGSREREQLSGPASKKSTAPKYTMKPVVRQNYLKKLHKSRMSAATDEGQDRIRRTQAIQVGVAVPDMVRDVVSATSEQGSERVDLAATAAAKIDRARVSAEAWEGQLEPPASAAAFVLLYLERNLAPPPGQNYSGVMRVVRVSDFFRMNPLTRHEVFSLEEATEKLNDIHGNQTNPYKLMEQHLASKSVPVTLASASQASQKDTKKFDIFGDNDASDGEDTFAENVLRKKKTPLGSRGGGGGGGATALDLGKFDPTELTDTFGADPEALREAREVREEADELDVGEWTTFDNDDVGILQDDPDARGGDVGRDSDADDDEDKLKIALAGGKEAIGIGGDDDGDLLTTLKRGGDLRKAKKFGEDGSDSDFEDDEGIALQRLNNDEYALEAALGTAIEDRVTEIFEEGRDKTSRPAADAEASGAPALKRQRREEPVVEDPDINEERIRTAIAAAGGELSQRQLVFKFKAVLKVKPHLVERFRSLTARLCQVNPSNKNLQLKPEFRRGLRM